MHDDDSRCQGGSAGDSLPSASASAAFATTAGTGFQAAAFAFAGMRTARLCCVDQGNTAHRTVSCLRCPLLL